MRSAARRRPSRPPPLPRRSAPWCLPGHALHGQRLFVHPRAARPADRAGQGSYRRRSTTRRRRWCTYRPTCPSRGCWATSGTSSRLLLTCARRRGAGAILFTPHSAVRATYKGVQRQPEMRIMVLGHNIDGSRRQLLERFKSNPNTVLLGTSSFWEGIDVVGDALLVLVIAKLPFAVPTDPVFAARAEGSRTPSRSTRCRRPSSSSSRGSGGRSGRSRPGRGSARP